MPVKRKAGAAMDGASRSASGKSKQQKSSMSSQSSKSNKSSKSRKTDANAFSWPQPSAQPVYVVTCTSGYSSDGFHGYSEPQEAAVGVFMSEAVAYAAAIRQQIVEMEAVKGGPDRGMREAVTARKDLSMKARFQAMRTWIEQSDCFADSEVIECKIMRAKSFCHISQPQTDTDHTDDEEMEKDLQENLLVGLEHIKSVFNQASPADSLGAPEGLYCPVADAADYAF